MKKGYWIVAYRTVGDEATMTSYLALGERRWVRLERVFWYRRGVPLLRMRVRNIRRRWPRLAQAWRGIFGLPRGFSRSVSTGAEMVRASRGARRGDGTIRIDRV